MAKIEMELLKCFVLILGLRLQRYATSTKRYPFKKFLQTVNLFSQPELPSKGD